jgi:hypothetical protein
LLISSGRQICWCRRTVERVVKARPVVEVVVEELCVEGDRAIAAGYSVVVVVRYGSLG